MIAAITSNIQASSTRCSFDRSACASDISVGRILGKQLVPPHRMWDRLTQRPRLSQTVLSYSSGLRRLGMSRESVSVTPGMCSNAGRWQAAATRLRIARGDRGQTAQEPVSGKNENATAFPADQLQEGYRNVRKVEAAILAMLLSVSALPVFAAGAAVTLPLNDASQVRPRNVTVEAVRYRGSDALEVRLTGPYRGPDKDTFAFVPGLDFHDGTIEVDVAGSLLPSALSGARGFIGIAFRIDAEGGSFSCEGFYIRPTNARAED